MSKTEYNVKTARSRLQEFRVQISRSRETLNACLNGNVLELI